MKHQGCREFYSLGDSLGAAALIQSAAVQPVFSAIVAECAHADLLGAGVPRPASLSKPPCSPPTGSTAATPRTVSPLHGIARAPTPILAAFVYLPKELRGPAAGIFAALRNEGGSAGTTLGKTMVARRLPVHTDRLVENLNPFNTPFNEAMQGLRSFFYQQTGDPVGSQMMALDAIDQLRQQQAAAMAYLDAFWLFGILALSLIPLTFLMRRSVAEEGMHIGAE